MPGPASLATGAVFVDGDKHQQPTPVQLTPNPVNDHQPDDDLRTLDSYTTTDCTDPNFIISNRNVDAHSLYDHWDDADLRTGSHQHIIKGIDSQLHCFSGTVRKCLGISIFAALLVLPLLCAGFMFNASVHAYNHEQTCGGPELWAGMTQTAWWMNAWWTMIAMMLLAYFGEEYKRPILFLAAFPLIAVAIVISAFICPECGDLIAFIAALVFVVMLLGVIFWPFIAPLVIASILENRKTWVRYYSFKMFYNGFHFTTINPGNTTTWPVNALYAMPPRVCENRECVGGWPDTPPRGVVGLLEDIVVPFQYPGFCASPSSAPGWIKMLLLNVNTTSYDLHTSLNCTAAYTYEAVLSSSHFIYEVPKDKATFCSDTATMPQCCDLVRGFFASQACAFIPMVLVLVFLAAKYRTKRYLILAVVMVACGGGGFFVSLNLISN